MAIDKHQAWQAVDSSLETALINERLLQQRTCRSEDFIGGVTAFREK